MIDSNDTKIKSNFPILNNNFISNNLEKMVNYLKANCANENVFKGHLAFNYKLQLTIYQTDGNKQKLFGNYELAVARNQRTISNWAKAILKRYQELEIALVMKIIKNDNLCRTYDITELPFTPTYYANHVANKFSEMTPDLVNWQYLANAKDLFAKLVLPKLNQMSSIDSQLYHGLLDYCSSYCGQLKSTQAITKPIKQVIDWLTDHINQPNFINLNERPLYYEDLCWLINLKKAADRFNQILKTKQKLLLPIRYLPVYLNHDIPLTLLRHGDTNLIFQIKSVAELTNFLEKASTLQAYDLLNFLKALKWANIKINIVNLNQTIIKEQLQVKASSEQIKQILRLISRT